MSKTPEQYFQEQQFATDPAQGGFTPAERAFMQKYLGLEEGDVLRKLGIDPAGPPKDAAPDAHREMSREEPLIEQLRREPELLMVGFFLGEQEFTVPTVAVQSVIRYSPPAKLPAAPPFVAGVINLRGKVTPLVRLRDMIAVDSERQGEDQFIIICRRQGLQLGLLIERIHTMYRIPQADIDWAIEASLGINVACISGLVKLNDKLISIVSVDSIIDSILQR